MRRFLKKRFLGIPVLVILLTVVTAVAVLAATLLTIPSHVKIVTPPPAPTYDILAFSDEANTVPLTFIEWGEIEKGADSQNQDVYIKNVGNRAALVSVSAIGLPAGVTLVSTQGDLSLAAGQGGVWGVIELTLTVSSSATPGDINFDTVFTNTLAP